MAPNAREMLAEAAKSGEDLETVAHGLLARLAALTGLSSTYLAETNLQLDEQHILFSYNSSQVFHIPEDVTLPWSEAVSRLRRERQVLLERSAGLATAVAARWHRRRIVPESRLRRARPATRPSTAMARLCGPGT